MRIVYKKTILNKLDHELECAKRNGFEIECIYLDPKEYEEYDHLRYKEQPERDKGYWHMTFRDIPIWLDKS